MHCFTRGMLSLALLALAALDARADSFSFSFDTEIGPNFTTINEGGFWAVGVVSGELRMSKGPDPGTPNPSFQEPQFTRGGVRSVFEVDGDFEITVDFTLYDFTLPPTTNGLTESILGASNAGDRTNFFWILRFDNYLEAYYQFPQVAIGATPSAQMSGRYRITRSGATFTGWVAPPGSSAFVAIGTHPAFSGPAFVDLLGRQGTPFFHPPGPRGPIDVAFDNLAVEADTIVGAVPEPTMLLLLGIGVAAVCVLRRQSGLVGGEGLEPPTSRV